MLLDHLCWPLVLDKFRLIYSQHVLLTQGWGVVSGGGGEKGCKRTGRLLRECVSWSCRKLHLWTVAVSSTRLPKHEPSKDKNGRHVNVAARSLHPRHRTRGDLRMQIAEVCSLPQGRARRLVIEPQFDCSVSVSIKGVKSSAAITQAAARFNDDYSTFPPPFLSKRILNQCKYFIWRRMVAN